MPHYKEIFDTLSGRQVTHTKKRIAAGLLSLRRRLRKEIPVRTVEETLPLASWNIREFGRNAMFGHLSLPKTPFRLNWLNLGSCRYSFSATCSRSFSRCFLLLAKPFKLEQRCKLRFLPSDISSWCSSAPAVAIVCA